MRWLTTPLTAFLVVWTLGVADRRPAFVLQVDLGPLEIVIRV